MTSLPDQPPPAHPGPRRAGRPRQPAIDRRCQDAVVAVLDRHGFAGLSVNRICAAAGVTRAAFYRRWPSAEAALFDIFNRRFRDALLHDSGDLHADLFDFAIRIRRRYGDPVISACLPAIYEARRMAPALIAPITHAHRQRVKANLTTISSAVAAQGLQPLLPPRDLLFTLTGTLDQGYLRQREIDDLFLRRLIALLLQPA